MLDTSCPNTRTALDVVTRPALFADQPAIRAAAWHHLRFGKPTAGAKPQTCAEVLRALKPGAPEPRLSQLLRVTEPARLARIRRRAAQIAEGGAA